MRYLMLFLSVAISACSGDAAPPAHQSATETPAGRQTKQSEREILFYRHPMNPEITSPVPAMDSMGMPYTPVYADTAAGVISIDAAIMQSLGVRTATVKQGDLPRRIDTVGYIAWNESLFHHIHPRAAGWVGTVGVHSLGEQVLAGQKLFDYYAPDIVTAQREYLNALHAERATLLAASRERLLSLGMATREIEQLAKTGKVIRHIGFYAPFAGVVARLNVRAGMWISPATEAIGLAGLDSVWINAQVFPHQMQWLLLGQRAEVRVAGLPGKVFVGTLDFLAPEVDAVTRTRTARLTITTPEHLLMPGMYAEVRIEAQVLKDVLSIPLEALIRTGEATRVVLALGDGRFISRDVIAGPVIGERVVIEQGLAAGEQVVTSAQFLLDSEASLRQVGNRLNGATSTPESGQ